MIQNYSRVMLATNKYETEGARHGMFGYIIEVYADGKYEVEFSNSTGVTIAQLVVSEDELVLSPEPK